MGVTRRCSKVLLVDEERRVLLFSGIDRTKPDVPARWFPVGGGLEAGETAEDAAIRETYEETGLSISEPGPVILTHRFTFDFEGEEYDQEEWVYLVRTPTFEPSSRNWTETESATIREHRWWSIDELRATNEVVFPSDLANPLGTPPERLTHEVSTSALKRRIRVSRSTRGAPRSLRHSSMSGPSNRVDGGIHRSRIPPPLPA